MSNNFSFPYDRPYETQVGLMQECYASICKKEVAILESPTGTVNSQPLNTTGKNTKHSMRFVVLDHRPQAGQKPTREASPSELG